jgi:hypothetical protein
VTSPAGPGLPTNIGAPATRALVAAGFTDLRRLDGVAEERLLAMHGVGPKAVSRLREAMEAEGLRLS